MWVKFIFLISNAALNLLKDFYNVSMFQMSCPFVLLNSAK